MIAPRRRRPTAAGTAWSGAAVVVLVALAAAGAGERHLLSFRLGGWTVVDALRQAATVVAGAAVITAVAVLGSIVLRRRLSAPALGSPRRMTRRQRLLAGIAGLLALAAVITARVVRGTHSGRPTPKASHPTTPRGPAAHSQWHLAAGTSTVLITVSVLVVLAVALLLRSRRRRSEPVADVTPTTVLADAAAGGRRALLAAPDPRQAIIAAYLAMEQHLAEHGFLLARSRTAGEVLHDAAGHGYVNRDAGTVLVRLFERARFSAAPLTSADREHALTALGVLAARTPR